MYTHQPRYSSRPNYNRSSLRPLRSERVLVTCIHLVIAVKVLCSFALAFKRRDIRIYLLAFERIKLINQRQHLFGMQVNPLFRRRFSSRLKLPYEMFRKCASHISTPLHIPSNYRPRNAFMFIGNVIISGIVFGSGSHFTAKKPGGICSYCRCHSSRDASSLM